ncbi:MAG: thioredoxin 1 [Glaciecola sp.]|jgi:thioredoxin 1
MPLITLPPATLPTMTVHRDGDRWIGGVPAEPSVTVEASDLESVMNAIVQEMAKPEIQEKVAQVMAPEIKIMMSSDVDLGAEKPARMALIQGHFEVTPENLDEVLAGEGVTLIDVWGPNCTACLLMAPGMDEMAARLPEVRLVQLDGEKFRDLNAQLNVWGHPSYLLYRGGQEIARFIGSRGLDVFVTEIQAALA